MSKDKSELSSVAAWLAKLRAEGVNPRTDRAFVAWLSEDSSRRLELERCEATLGFARMLADDEELMAELEQNGSRMSATTESIDSRRAGWRAAAAIAATVAGIAILSLVWQGTETYETGIGEQRTVVLSDGSTITLNTDSRLSVAFERDTRKIDLLGGEGYFEVASDSSRPFEVHAGGGVIRAVGTAFDVNIRGDQVTVAVLEGTVAVVPTASGTVEESPGSPILSVGESLSYWQDGMLSPIERGAAERLTSWRQGEIDLNGATLTEAVAEHNRYTTRDIFVGSDEIADLRVSGVVKIRDTESLLFLLEQTLAVQAIRRPDGIVIVPGE